MIGQEVVFGKNELIVTKTDLKGVITYANRTFMRIANYAEKNLLGLPHNIVRHPDMPKGVFFSMWRNLQNNKEFFGLVKNYTSDKNYYWVFANITPDVIDGNVIGYYSVRRHAPTESIKFIEPIYAQMCEIEKQRKSQSAVSSWQWLEQLIQQEYNQGYEEFIVNLYQKHVGAHHEN